LYDFGEDGIGRDHISGRDPDGLFPRSTSIHFRSRWGFLADGNAEESVLDLVSNGQVSSRSRVSSE
jgi:hypothetical protein